MKFNTRKRRYFNIKKGGNINKEQNYLTIITPCVNQENLDIIKKSMDFTKNILWIIVYDTTSKTFEHKYKGEQKIVEYECIGFKGGKGNPQRNFGLNKVTKGFVYFLDDDNIMHPKFWNIFPAFVNTYIYTFDQKNTANDGIRFKGYNTVVGRIDTAQYVVPFEMIKDLRWEEEKHEADALFIIELQKRYPNNIKYIEGIYCYYNFIDML